MAWEEAERQRTGVGLVETGPPINVDRDGMGNGMGEAREGDAQTSPPGLTVAPSKGYKRTREEMMGGISEAELDEYRRKKTAANDPMAKMLDADELVQ